MKAAFLITFFFFYFSLSYSQELNLKKGLIISKSSTVKKGTYLLNANKDLSKPVIIIEGSNITVDFNNATLNGVTIKGTGISKSKTPDEFEGVAIIIRGGKNITIKNLTAKGYKVAVIANNIEDLKIENCNFSYNYRPRLNSTQEKEDISDWMSYHQNEKDEWLRYGAAMYLRGCNNPIINNCKVTGGQNALMMMECNNGMIFNNDFSFNSGIGLGMYKCNNNKVLYNKLDFNVRGYSDGVYNRGQDSAGILLYEQSNNNLFYKNSVTHGGDGFFLWAGQTTMDTGKGGCNDNTLMDNDFSYAPTNGIEVTFSRNKIIHNRIFECDHGIWGGYSYNTQIQDNKFQNNRIGIAIEHGQENNILYNAFSKNKESIRLWARKQQPSDWGYAKYRDTRSRNYLIEGNSFNNDSIVLNVTLTDSLHVFDNIYNNYSILFKTDSSVTNMDTEPNEALSKKFEEDSSIKIPDIQNPIEPFKGGGKLAGRKNILITPWGPYNFQYPLIWNVNPIDSNGIMVFNVLGTKGRWKIISSKGLNNISKRSDSMPSNFTANKTVASITDIEVVAEYKGPAFYDAFGNYVPANKPYRFSFSKFFQPIDFTVKWFGFDSTNNPIKFNSAQQIQQKAPFKTEKTNKLDYAWWGGIKAGNKQYTQFLTVAEGKANIIKGTYELSVTWDDAVRVYIDDKLVLNEWNPSKYTFDESPNKKITLPLGGNHKFRVEHVELAGFATLSLKLKKIR